MLKPTRDKIELNKKELEKDGISESDFYMDDCYQCSTCDNVGKSHPETSLCFICGDDNWEIVKGKESELGI